MNKLERALADRLLRRMDLSVTNMQLQFDALAIGDDAAKFAVDHFQLAQVQLAMALHSLARQGLVEAMTHYPIFNELIDELDIY